MVTMCWAVCDLCVTKCMYVRVGLLYGESDSAGTDMSTLDEKRHHITPTYVCLRYDLPFPRHLPHTHISRRLSLARAAWVGAGDGWWSGAADTAKLGALAPRLKKHIMGAAFKCAIRPRRGRSSWAFSSELVLVHN